VHQSSVFEGWGVDLILTDWSTHGIDASQTGRVRHALICEKIVWVGIGQPSDDFEIGPMALPLELIFRVADPSVCKGPGLELTSCSMPHQVGHTIGVWKSESSQHSRHSPFVQTHKGAALLCGDAVVYNKSMAKNVIHFPEAEAAATNVATLLAHVRAGAEVIIENGARPVAVLRSAEQPPGRLLSESIALAKAHGSTVTLDGDFGRDLEEIINSHREPLNPRAWD
jgi:antitoxin (DNA-binding transcriptional repressor) of toxin-antitoxin stability system